MYLITYMLPNGRLLRRVMDKSQAEAYIDQVEAQQIGKCSWVLLSLEYVTSEPFDRILG
jgi:hypothetical protein